MTYFGPAYNRFPLSIPPGSNISDIILLWTEGLSLFSFLSILLAYLNGSGTSKCFVTYTKTHVVKAT
jgi:hypothetical protein